MVFKQIYGTTKYMKKSSAVAPKRRGRPAIKGGRDPHIAARMPPALIAAVEAWAETNKTSRSDAFRRLVELGLTVKAKSRPTGRLSAALVADLAVEAIDSLGTKVKAHARPADKPGRRLRAQELATKAIEKIIDPAAAPEEQAQRRRRLTKRPPEFRQARLDQPKAKGK
ncbi:hypothetical protein [Bradyrhizobium sp. JYMT SZCCT0428]|uniref:hypothetical protein n=1 Tax=Bradyrhizobium sp. JYMT SZCCT0428 TaxID=2807673 RepID=UPI002013557A|nr:hypothetical protein [Bradyrhizobium sp. JYMT SZCCT0428]